MTANFPPGWKLMAVDACMAAVIDYRGKSPRKVSSGIPLITAKIVKDGRILPPDEYVAEEEYEEWMCRGIPAAGDVLLTTEAPLGEVAQLDGRKVALAQRLITLRGRPEVLDNRFLKFAMQTDFVQSQLRARATGTTVHGIRQSELREVQLPIPPLSEQRAIARILGTLDDKIELNRRMNETLEAIARAIFKSWFVDFEPVRAKMEGRWRRGQSLPGLPAHLYDLFPDSFQDSPLGKIPKGWKVGKLDELLEILGGGTPKTSVAEFWDGEIPWYSVGDAPNPSDLFVIDTEKKITKAGLEGCSTRLLPQNTTIISARGTVGRLALAGAPLAMNQSCYALRPKGSQAEYFTYYLVRGKVDELSQSTHGTVFDTITRDTFKVIDAVIPPGAASSRFDERVAPLLARILSNVKESKALAAIRDALLPKLISGEIRVKAGKKWGSSIEPLGKAW